MYQEGAEAAALEGVLFSGSDSDAILRSLLELTWFFLSARRMLA